MSPWTPVLLAFGATRCAIGLAPIVAPVALGRAFGFPDAENTESARVFARLFGVRDLGLGALAFYLVAHPELRAPVFVLQALTDLGDLATFLAGMSARPDLRGPLGRCAAIAAPAALSWTALWALS